MKRMLLFYDTCQGNEWVVDTVEEMKYNKECRVVFRFDNVQYTIGDEDQIAQVRGDLDN